MKYLFIALGGALGAVLRYMVAGLFSTISYTSFPYGTLSVNLIGSFLIGFLWAILGNRIIIPNEYKVLIFVGFIGAFTTFSTYTFETFKLLQNGEIKFAVLNFLYNNVFGIILVVIGIILGNMLIKL